MTVIRQSRRYAENSVRHYSYQEKEPVVLNCLKPSSLEILKSPY